MKLSELKEKSEAAHAAKDVTAEILLYVRAACRREWYITYDDYFVDTGYKEEYLKMGR